jgi:ferredoxin
MWERLDYREKYIPRVVTNPCFPAMTSDIQCDRCLAACSWNLVSRDKGTITIDTDQCLFCGECYAACPGDIVVIDPLEDMMFTLRRDREQGAAVLNLFCDHVNAGQLLGSLQVPTLSYVTPELLFWAAAIGFEEVSIATSNCGECRTGCRQTFDEALAEVSVWLRSWKRELRVVFDDVPKVRAEKPERVISRRELFRGLSRRVGSGLSELVAGEVMDRLPMLIPRAQEGVMRRQALKAIAMKMLGTPFEIPDTAVQPVIEDTCEGCRLCAKLCTRGAILYDAGGLTIKPWLCSGCGFCVKTCPDHLISIAKVEEWKNYFRSARHAFAPAALMEDD